MHKGIISKQDKCFLSEQMHISKIVFQHSNFEYEHCFPSRQEEYTKVYPNTIAA